jgi:hypothetical protein
VGTSGKHLISPWAAREFSDVLRSNCGQVRQPEKAVEHQLRSFWLVRGLGDSPWLGIEEKAIWWL